MEAKTRANLSAVSTTVSTDNRPVPSEPTNITAPFTEVVPSILQLLERKDKETRAHSSRVHTLTRDWLTYLRLRKLHLEIKPEVIELAALLHDVGKIAVLDEVLNKPGRLTEVERAHLELHAELGYQMVRDLPAFAEVAEGVRYHHERWDGRGYPLGLRERQIPIAARFIAIIDTFDAITSDRPYQKARSVEFAMKEIEKEAGRQFCPELVTRFLEFMHARNT